MIIIAPFSNPVWQAIKSDVPAMYKALRLYALLAMLFGVEYLLMLALVYWLVVGLSGIASQILIGLLSLFYGG